MSADVHIRLFGVTEAVVAGRRVALGPPLQRAVLSALAVDAGQVVAADQLVDRVWGDRPPRTARKNVQKYVHQLRTTLGRHTILWSGGGYRLDIASDQVDVCRLVADAAAVAEVADDRARFELTTSLLAATVGEPLPDLQSSFGEIERARLSELRLSLIDGHLGNCLALGRTELVIGEASELSELHPFQERFWRLWMTALYRTGRQAEALEVFQRLRRLLDAELGIEPTVETCDLERRILVQDPSLGGGSSPSAGPDEEPAIALSEQRPITIVAADHRRDTLTASVLAGHGGRIVDVDGMVLGVFGVPAGDDDHVRAAAAALEIAGHGSARCTIRSVRTVVVDASASLELRQALVDDLSRRLEAGGTGVVSTDESTAATLGSKVRLERAADGGLRLVELGARRGHDRSVGDLVGRGFEVAQLTGFWASCAEGPASQLVMIVGEAGIGKSALVDRFRTELSDRNGPTVWLQTTCEPLADAPYGPIERLLRSRFGPAPLTAAREVLTVNGVDDREATWLLELSSLLLDPGRMIPASQVESLRAWARLLTVGLDSGSVIAIEDVHNATGPLDEFLAEVVTLAATPIVVLLTTRRARPGPIWPATTAAVATILPLGPLAVEPTRTLAAKGLGREQGDEAVGHVVERSGGNPLYINELARAVVDGKGTTLPDSIRNALISRIDRADLPSRLVLQAMALHGGAIASETLAPLVDLPAGSLAAAITELRHQGLVKAPPEQWGSQRIAHPLVAEVALDLVPAQRQFDLHDRLAAIYSAGGIGERSLGEAEQHAHHAMAAWRLATEHGSELAQPNDQRDLRRRAADAALVLARRLSHLDAKRSLQLATAALDATEPGTATRAHAALTAARCAGDLGEWSSAEGLLGQAIAVFEAQGDSAAEVEARLVLATQRWLRGEVLPADEIERCVALTGGQPGPGYAAVLALEAAVAARAGAVAVTLDIARTAGPIVEAHGSLDARVRFRHAVALARLEAGERAGLDDLQSTLDLCLDHGLTRHATAVHNNLGNNVWLYDGPDAAEPILEEAIAFSLDRGYLYAADFIEGTLAEVLFDAGRWVEALHHASGLMDRLTNSDHQDDGNARDAGVYVAGLIALWQGRARDAAALLDEQQVGKARAAGDLQYIVPWLNAVGQAEAANDNRASARARFDELLTRTEQDDQWRSYAAHNIVRFLLADGEKQRARRIVPASQQSIPRSELARATALALLEEADGRRDEALRAHRAAGAAWRKSGYRLEAALASESESRVLAALGRRPESAAARKRSIDELAVIGADAQQPWWLGSGAKAAAAGQTAPRPGGPRRY